MDPGRTGAPAIVIVVPDASVLLKWVIAGDDEPQTGAALSLRDEAVSGTIELLVPQLWIYSALSGENGNRYRPTVGAFGVHRMDDVIS